MSDVEAVETIEHILDLARSALDPGVHAWGAAGAGQEVTVARNTIALNSLALVPRVGRDVSSVDTSTTFMGIRCEMPVALAPVGALAIYDPGDARAAAEAATAVGTSVFCSLFTESSWEEVAATSPGRHVLQLYAEGDRAWLGDVIRRVDELDFGGICVTLDSPVIGRRDRSLASGYKWRRSPGSAMNYDEAGTHPRHRSGFTWSDFEWVCAQTRLPVVAKGIMSPDDAREAVSSGARAVYVSNHGGRMVDHSLSTIEVLREIVEAVPPDVDVAVDSGFTRGAEVCKALALGAKLVGIGRLQCWSLAAGGSAMLLRALEILGDEIEKTMANIGCRSLAEIVPESVRWSIPALPQPEVGTIRPAR
jgi:isopentenyl diphosphate isomerase/L-lactate dehydrogenase-like FMN-dependent dehydrogenase